MGQLFKWLRFKPRLCSVHNCELQRDTVPILYGLIRYPEEYREAHEKRFPNANTEVLGGCRVGEAKTREVYFCSECRRELEVWDKHHSQNEQEREYDEDQ